MFGHVHLVARKIGRIHRLAVDVLVVHFGMGREPVRNALPQVGNLRRHLVHADMERFQADIDAGVHVANQRRCQAIRERRRDHQRDLAVDMLAHQPDQIPGAVHGDGGVLGKEISGVEGFARIGIDQRVVIGGVGLGFDLTGRGDQSIDDGAEELRQAADPVAVLDQLILAFRPVAACFRANGLAA